MKLFIKLRDVLNNPRGVNPSIPRHPQLASVKIRLGDKIRLILSRIPRKQLPTVNDGCTNGKSQRTLLQDIDLLSLWELATTL